MATQVQIPPIKTGVDFLASSHFNIGDVQGAFHHTSTFQNDYLPQRANRVSTTQKPPPAHIMHGDHRINEQCSVNKEQFCRRNGPPARNPISKNTLTKTNFKLDHDSRAETFTTTNNAFHYPMDVVGNKSRVSKEPMKSFIPQGDRLKEICTKSLYKEDFPHKYVANSTNEALVANASSGAVNVLKGDVRSHGNDMFGTTSKRELPAYYGHSKAVIPGHIHYPKTSLPGGGGNEANLLQSTHQMDYNKKLPPISTTSPSSNERQKSADLLKTQFVNGDKRMTNFKTVGHDYGDFGERSAADLAVAAPLDMRKSNFPPGDGIPVAGRRATTMNSTSFTAPPTNFRNPIVDASNRHTASTVDFGDSKTSYETTTNSTFQHMQGGDYSKMRNEAMHRSFTLHENNLGNTDNVSSYTSAYKSTLGVKKLEPNPVAIENLKKSYIVEPIRGLREFSTTQREAYTPKERSRVFVDTHRLHRSSVPVGSLSK